MMNKKSTLVIWTSIFIFGFLLFASCNNTNNNQEEAEQTAKKYQNFQTPDSILRKQSHWLSVDGWNFEAEIVKVTDKRIRVYNEEYQREFEFPLFQLSDVQKLLVTEWQAYHDLNKAEGELASEAISETETIVKDTIVPDTSGYELQIVNIPLKEIVLRVEFTYLQTNRGRADQMLKLLKLAIPDYEEKTGIPFPGFNPYMVLENLNLKSLGLAGPTDAYLCSLDKASEWTLLHEFVHIWNSGGGPAWVSEGLADYIAYQGMIEYGGKFLKNENYQKDLKFWKEFKGTEDDFPLSEKKYDYKYAGTKTMVFWEKLNKEFSDEFTNACFRHNAMNKKLTNDDFRNLLKQYGEEDPDRIMSGWIVTGDYRF